VRKSKERLERVRAYTIEFQKKTKEESDEVLVGVSLFVLGDLFTTLIRTGQTVALAVLQATAIDCKGRKMSSISAGELSIEAADINISGQVLHLIAPSSPINMYSFDPAINCPSTRSTLHTPLATNTNPPIILHDNSYPSLDQPLSPVSAAVTNERPINASVFWTGNYIKFNPLRAKKDKGKQTATSASEKVSRNALVLTTPSYLIEPVSGLLVGMTTLSDSDANVLSEHGLAETWYFDAGCLNELAASLWDMVTTKRWKILEAGISFNDLFPYGVDMQDGLFLHILTFVDIG
jgi:hypothetical protein